MNAITCMAFELGRVVAASIGLFAFGSARWRVATQAQMAQLERARVRTPAGRNDASEIDSFPVPVKRYFCAVFTDGQPPIAAASFEFAGTFNMFATGDQRKPFTSIQRGGTHCQPKSGLSVERPGGAAARPHRPSARQL